MFKLSFSFLLLWLMDSFSMGINKTIINCIYPLKGFREGSDDKKPNVNKETKTMITV